MLSHGKRGALAFGPFARLARQCALLCLVLSCSEPRSDVQTAAAGEAGPHSTQETEWVVFEGRTSWSEMDLVARLQPLLGSSDRRAFDARAWALPEGQIPWSLQLDLAAPDQEGVRGAPEHSLDLSDLVVEHRGPNPLRFREVSPENGVYEPLQVLLAAPDGVLAPGGFRRMVFIGPADLKNPILAGWPLVLELQPNAERTAQGPVDSPILDFTAQSKQ